LRLYVCARIVTTSQPAQSTHQDHVWHRCHQTNGRLQSLQEQARNLCGPNLVESWIHFQQENLCESHRTRQNLVQMPSLRRRSKQDATAGTQRRASNLPIRDTCAEKRERYKLQSGSGNPRATIHLSSRQITQHSLKAAELHRNDRSCHLQRLGFHIACSTWLLSRVVEVRVVEA